MNSEINILKKKKLERDIKQLDKHEYIEILNIIKKNNQKYSKNSTGIFFNLKYINDKTIMEIIHFVEFCKKNKIFLEKEVYNEEKSSREQEKLQNHINGSHNFENLDDIKIDIQDILDSKNNKATSFTFKNYLDKISIVPKKEFKNKQPSQYPNLININNEFTGSNNRILKKCKNLDTIHPKFTESISDNMLEAEVHI